MATMRIGEFARAGGISIPAVRYYERRRLLPSPPRSTSGQRLFCDRDLQVLKIILQAKRLGFTLREIREALPLVALTDGRGNGNRARSAHHACCVHVAAICERKLTALDERIGALRGVQCELQAMLEKARAAAKASGAPAPKRRLGRARPTHAGA